MAGKDKVKTEMEEHKVRKKGKKEVKMEKLEVKEKKEEEEPKTKEKQETKKSREDKAMKKEKKDQLKATKEKEQTTEKEEKKQPKDEEMKKTGAESSSKTPSAVTPAAQPAPLPAVQPALQPALQPAPQPAVQLAVQPVLHPAPQPAPQPADGKGLDQMEELLQKMKGVLLTDEQIKLREEKTAATLAKVEPGPPKPLKSRAPPISPESMVSLGSLGSPHDSGFDDLMEGHLTRFCQFNSSSSSNESFPLRQAQSLQYDASLSNDLFLDYDTSLLNELDEILSSSTSPESPESPGQVSQQVPANYFATAKRPEAPRPQPVTDHSQRGFQLMHSMIANQLVPSNYPSANSSQSRKRALLLVNFLPANVFDLSTVDSNGWSCLHLFIAESSWIIDKLAVSHEHLLSVYFDRIKRHFQLPNATPINLDIRNSFGETPLYMAIQRNMSVVVASLLSYGANLEVPCGYQQRYSHTPLHCAVRMRNAEIVRILLHHAHALDSSGAVAQRLCELKDGQGHDARSAAWELHSPPTSDMTSIINILDSFAFQLVVPELVEHDPSQFGAFTDQLLDLMESQVRIDAMESHLRYDIVCDV